MSAMSIADIRRDYQRETLDEKDVAPQPFAQFTRWWQEAVNSSIDEVNAMTLSTVDANGHPNARVVLLKGYDDAGFVFFTNYHSAKGRELEARPYASLLFFWKELERQVRISGKAEKIAAEDSDAYFESRPAGSRLGAWVSDQSAVISGRHELEEKLAGFTDRYPDGNIARPPHWGGYRVIPDAFEFWQGRSSRLHDRIRYRKQNDGWLIERLSP